MPPEKPFKGDDGPTFSQTDVSITSEESIGGGRSQPPSSENTSVTVDYRARTLPDPVPAPKDPTVLFPSPSRSLPEPLESNLQLPAPLAREAGARLAARFVERIETLDISMIADTQASVTLEDAGKKGLPGSVEASRQDSQGTFTRGLEGPLDDRVKSIDVSFLPKGITEQMWSGARRDNCAFERTVLHDEQIRTDDNIIILCKGQLALGIFSESVIQTDATIAKMATAERQGKKDQHLWRLLNLPPLMERATRNVAYFSVNNNEPLIIDIDELIIKTAFLIPKDHKMVLYSVIESTMLSINVSTFLNWRDYIPSLNDKYLDDVSHLASLVSSASQVDDLLVRHGLTTAQKIRVLDRNKCNTCGDCEQACASRYGQKRLSIDAFSVGWLSMVDACRVCEDPRCMSACPKEGALSFQSDEIVVNQQKCIGCAKCRTACPYNAIDMIFVQEEQEADSTKQEKSEKINKKTLAPKADKCDHCINHRKISTETGEEPQACIAACRRGALYEVDPGQLLQGLSSRRVVAKSPAHEISRIAEEARVLPDQTPPATHRGYRILWLSGGLSLIIGSTEILLRRYSPKFSLLASYWQIKGHEELVANIRDFQPGQQLGVAFGAVSLLMLILAFSYSAFSRLAPGAGLLWRKMGTLRSALSACDFHLWVGVMAPAVALLHIGYQLSPDRDSLFFGRVAMISMIFIAALGGLLRWLPKYFNHITTNSLEAEMRLRQKLRALLSQSQQRFSALVFGYIENHDIAIRPILFGKKNKEDEQDLMGHPGQKEQRNADWHASVRAAGRLIRGSFSSYADGLEREIATYNHQSLAEVLEVVEEIIRARHLQALVPLLTPTRPLIRYGHIFGAVMALLFTMAHVIYEWYRRR